MYVDKVAKALDLPGVIWYVVPPGAGGKGYYHGQFYAIAHCLNINKVWGTQWSLFIDLDEYLAPLRDIRAFTETVQGPRHSITFGTMSVDGINFKTGDGGGIKEVLTKGGPRSWSLGGPASYLNCCMLATCPKGVCENPECPFTKTCAGSHGKRKQLINVSTACMPFVHQSENDFIPNPGSEDECRGPGVVEIMNTDVIALSHLRGLGHLHCANASECQAPLTPDTHPADDKAPGTPNTDGAPSYFYYYSAHNPTPREQFRFPNASVHMAIG